MFYQNNDISKPALSIKHTLLMGVLGLTLALGLVAFGVKQTINDYHQLPITTQVHILK